MDIDIITSVKSFVRGRLKDEPSGHGYDHALRVYNNTRRILELLREKDDCPEFRDIDDTVVLVAALVHDVVDDKVDNRLELTELRKVLLAMGLDGDRVDRVLTIVDNISFRKGVGPERLTPEAKIVQDADRLDAMGAIGIARVFMYSGRTGRPMGRPGEPGGESGTAVQHFYDKLLKLRDMMNTPPARREAEVRHKVMLDYLRELDREMNEWQYGIDF